MTQIDPCEFWRWAYSDFLSNTLRGVLAEHIVSRAAGCEEKPRTEWDAYDLITPAGLKLEVKSAAYLQSWQQDRVSTIRFDIAPRLAWDSLTNTSASTPVRSADRYVFCVFATKDKSCANPLDLSQWFFLTCPTHELDQRLGSQKSVALSRLEEIGLEKLDFIALSALLAN